MIGAIEYEDMLEDIREANLPEDTIGILIARPTFETGKTILEDLPYYHHLTGKYINFYLPGYGAYWPVSEYPDKKDVIKIDNVTWSFSNKRFVDFVSTMESNTTWKYSGESELILVKCEKGHIDYSETLVFKLDDMIKDKIISSVSSLITSLTRITKETNELSSIYGKRTLGEIKNLISDEFDCLSPHWLKVMIKRGKYCILRNCTKWAY